ncbi:MAG: hypothetical protein MUF25_18965 [Pirellulaceae bacterium]|jgi:hypothetical protein|nr:hypothetical protein [Pirellulaceae bacterium]
MKTIRTQPNDKRQLAKREDQEDTAPDYSPPRVEKTNRLADVTGQPATTGIEG